MSVHIDRVLCGWQQKSNLSNDGAAHLCGVAVQSIKNWRDGKPISLSLLQKNVLPAMGCRTLEEAIIKFDSGIESSRIYDDFFENSEAVFLKHIRAAKRVRETRLMMPGYPAPITGYRADMNQYCYSRILDGSLRVSKVEQINNYERAVDILANVREFDWENYDVRIIPATNWIPYMNFSIFDRTSVVIGGYHKTTGPPRDPFMDFVGHKYVDMFERAWGRLEEIAGVSSMDSEFEQSVFEHVRLLGVDISEAGFFGAVEERQSKLAILPARAFVT